jgi:hypothetical protein
MKIHPKFKKEKTANQYYDYKEFLQLNFPVVSFGKNYLFENLNYNLIVLNEGLVNEDGTEIKLRQDYEHQHNRIVKEATIVANQVALLQFQYDVEMMEHSAVITELQQELNRVQLYDNTKGGSRIDENHLVPYEMIHDYCTTLVINESKYDDLF